jgi:hypothetical protein
MEVSHFSRIIVRWLSTPSTAWTIPLSLTSRAWEVAPLVNTVIEGAEHHHSCIVNTCQLTCRADELLFIDCQWPVQLSSVGIMYCQAQWLWPVSIVILWFIVVGNSGLLSMAFWTGGQYCPSIVTPERWNCHGQKVILGQFGQYCHLIM